MKKIYKKIMFGTAILAACLTLAFAFATYKQDSGGTLLPDITYTAKANGNASERTTEIVFEFSAYVASLTKDDITIDGSSGSASKDTLTGGGMTWTLKVKEITAGAAAVSVTRAGIDSGSVGITLYDGSNGGSGGGGVFSTAPNISVTAGNAALTVNLTNAPSPTPDSYDVYYLAGSGKTAAEVMAGTQAGTGVSLPYTISGLSNGTAYSVVAVAKKVGYADSVSNVDEGTPYTASKDLSIKFNVTPSGTTTVQEVTDTFNAVHAYLATNPAVTGTGTGTKIGVIEMGDYIDLVSLTIAADAGGGGVALNSPANSTLLRLIVVGINTFRENPSPTHTGSYANNGSEAAPHLVFQFQNIPATHRMNPSQTNIGGYALSEMRTYVNGNFLAGLSAAGVPDSVLWAPKRFVANGGASATAADEVRDKLWLPTEREMNVVYFNSLPPMKRLEIRRSLSITTVTHPVESVIMPAKSIFIGRLHPPPTILLLPE